MFYKEKAYYFLIGFFCFIISSVAAQDQKLADSARRIYKQDTAKGKAKLLLLKTLAFNEVNDLELALKYSDELISLAKQQGNSHYLYSGYLQRGNKKRLLGDLDEALAAFFESAKVANKANFIKGEGSSYMTVADIYSISGNHENAMRYYNKSISILRNSGDSSLLAAAISNAGDEFLKNKNYDSAIVYFTESGSISEKVNYLIGKAYSLGNIGMVYASTGENDLAEKNINEAIQMLEQLNDYYPICVYLISMCDVYLNKGDQHTALNYALRSLKLAQHYNLKEQIRDANLKLSELYEKRGNLAQSFRYYKNYIAYRDSVSNLKSLQKMYDLRTDFELSQKQAEVDLLNQNKKNQRLIVITLIIILASTTIILGTLYWYYRSISKEKRRSESLLLNILPAETAKELKQNGRVNAVRFNKVTVLFSDFVQFSRLAEHVEPEQLVRSIDFYFKEFDEITTRYGLEKIKTIGDSYMCAGGLPTANPGHAINVVNAAKEMIDLVNKKLSADDGLNHFEIRIGIHTGPVVAGIVGIKKWQYDIWGDTVNIASRMESMSNPGRINLSEFTWQEIKDYFPCEYRGEIEVKNHGALKMYFLS